MYIMLFNKLLCVPISFYESMTTKTKLNKKIK